jgi:hypothetical protein
MGRACLVLILFAAGCVDDPSPAPKTRERSLVLRGPDGVERELARDVADPRFETSDGRRRVVFTQLPPGRDIAPDTTGHLVVLDLDRGTRRTVSDHPLDSSPFIVPGSDDVLFVSGRTGIASLYLARPGRAPRQLTNVGMRRLDPATFVPVPGRELEWIPGTRTAIFVARYGGEASRWQLDVDTGVAERLP